MQHCTKHLACTYISKVSCCQTRRFSRDNKWTGRVSHIF